MKSAVSEWYHVPNEYASCLRDVASEPEFSETLEILLQDTAAFEQQELYRLDINSSTHITATKFILDKETFYELQVCSKRDENAIVTYSQAHGYDDSGVNELPVIAKYLPHIFGSVGLPQDFVNAYQSMVLDPNNRERILPVLERVY